MPMDAPPSPTTSMSRTCIRRADSDKDSEGLADPHRRPCNLAARITQPRRQALKKVYLVQVERIPDDDALEALRRGVEIKGKRTRPALMRNCCPDSARPPRTPCPHPLSQECSDRVAAPHPDRGPQPSGPPHDRRCGASHPAFSALGNWTRDSDGVDPPAIGACSHRAKCVTCI